MQISLTTYNNTARLEFKRVYDDWPKVAFILRTERLISIGYQGRGINFHRRGGVSITGFPRSGGTSIGWGKFREVVEGKDLELLHEGEKRDALVKHYGPFMVRVGRDF